MTDLRGDWGNHKTGLVGYPVRKVLLSQSVFTSILCQHASGEVPCASRVQTGAPVGISSLEWGMSAIACLPQLLVSPSLTSFSV